jgi:hypothetical protein
MSEADQAGQTRRIIIVVYSLVITDMTGIGTRKKRQQCFRVNIFTIRALVSVDINDSIQYLYIKGNARIFNIGCWPFTWWCRSEPLPDEGLLAGITRQQPVLPSRAESEDEELLEGHEVDPVSIHVNTLLGSQKMHHYSKHNF